MSIVVACPACGLSLKAGEEHIGRQAKCSGCGTVFNVERGGAPPGAAAPSPAARAEPRRVAAGAGSRIDRPYAPPHYRETRAAEDLPPVGVIRFGEGLSRGFDVLHSNVGTFILIALVFIGIHVGLGILQQIPFLGVFVALANGFFIGPVLTGGFTRASLGQHDGIAAQVGDLFAEFERWTDFVLLALVQFAIAMGVILVPSIALGFVAVAAAAGGGRGRDVEPVLIVVLVGVGLVIVVLAIALSMVFCFAYCALIDRRAGFWDAIKTSWSLMKGNPLGTFGTAFLSGLIAAAGFLACGIGGLYTVPAAYCIVAATYRTAQPAPPVVGAAGPEGSEAGGGAAGGIPDAVPRPEERQWVPLTEEAKPEEGELGPEAPEPRRDEPPPRDPESGLL